MSTTSREVLQIDIAQVLLQTGHRLWTFYSTTVRCRYWTRARSRRFAKGARHAF